MFVIPSEQFEQMKQRLREPFQQRVLMALRETVPGEVADLDDRALLEQIATAHERASEHGVVTEQGIAKWVLLCLALSPTFDELPSIEKFWAETNLAADVKVSLLLDSFMGHLKAGAES